MLFQGRAVHKVRIVQKATMIGSVYQQHRHHYMAEGFSPNINFIEKFRTDLVTQLRQWRSLHECLILFIDANENTVDSPLNSALSAPDLLMREGVYSLHPSLPQTPSFQQGDQVGRHPIDAVYLTPDLPSEAGTWISKIRSPGDHYSCIIEIHWKALVVEDMFKIARPDAHHLSSSAYHLTVEYSKVLASYEAQHKLLFKSHNLYGETNGPLTQEQQDQFESID
jgi:hypothetical protein